MSTSSTVPVTIVRVRLSKRVLFLECTSDFAEVLASFSVLPLGAILRLLEDAKLKDCAKTCLHNLHNSLDELDNYSFMCKKRKLTNPLVPDEAHYFFRGWPTAHALSLNTSVVFVVKNDLSIVKASCGVFQELLRSAKVERIDSLEKAVVYVTKKTVLNLLLAALNLSSDLLTEVFGPLLEKDESSVTVEDASGMVKEQETSSTA